VIGSNWDRGLPVKFKIERYGEREIECCGPGKGKMREESCVMWVLPHILQVSESGYCDIV
jgi:hypothetical protein